VRTLHVDTGREMRGGQWQALYLVERLTGATLLARDGSPLLEEAARRGLDVRALSLGALISAARQAGLVHAHDARAHTLAAMASGTPLVVSRRVAFPVKRGFFSRRKYARAKMFLAVSRFVAAQLLDAGIPEGKIRVVHDGVPIPERATPQPGRVMPGKVIALASKPVEIPGISVDLTHNLWEDLSTASVFVYQSEMEGLGSAALAAMAAGVPVVASSVGGLPEAVEHGRTGFLVADGDFATPVRRLLEDPALALEMSRASRERAEQEFSVDLMVEKTLRAYAEVLGC
jgi:hypothetical protein